MSKIEATTRTQIDLLHRISRVVDNMKKLGKEKITTITITTRLELLESHWKTFHSTHQSLVAVRSEESDPHSYFANEYYEQCETAYLNNKEELLTIRQTLKTPADDLSLHDSACFAARHTIARALPKISLPRFSGDYSSWPAFRDLFTSMIISNPDILPVEKLHYLKNNLGGEASRRIANFAVTADNFERAWNALMARYENKRVLVNSYLDQLFNVKPLTRKSPDELKELLATVNETLGGLQSLEAPVDQWDYFLVYFLAKRLDPDSREAWEIHQGSTMEPAKYSDLLGSISRRTYTRSRNDCAE